MLDRHIVSNMTIASSSDLVPYIAGSITLEANAKKRAKLTPSPKQPEHTMSDSDDTDSLTKLNTTLNKSMALMENKTAKVKLNTSRKSVSINTKYQKAHTPIDAKSQKSILKKPAEVVGNDNSESSSDSQEQNVPEILQPVNDVTITPKTIKRPINLQNLKHQENLINDSTKASFGLGDISDDDEIYILDVPRTIDLTELKGQTIKLGGKNRLTIGNQLYETCNKEATNISCVFRTDKKQSSYQTVNLRPAGCINIRQKLSKPLGVELSSFEKKTVPFPDKLKIRHPLFGAEYEDIILMANKKVPKLMGRSIKREELIAETNATATVEKSPPKLKVVEKNKIQKVEPSKKPNKSENNSKDRVKKSLNLDDSDSASSDSDSDGSFFQQVKLENIGKHEKRKKSKKCTSILNLEGPLLAPDIPENLDETLTDVKQKELSGNKKLGLSRDSSGIKNTSFLLNARNSQFFSSTPIKIENSGEKIPDGEILTNKVRKRKTNDGVIKVTKSPKKVKRTNWSMSTFETTEKKISA